jgi:hypothetical protein
MLPVVCGVVIQSFTERINSLYYHFIYELNTRTGRDGGFPHITEDYFGTGWPLSVKRRTIDYFDRIVCEISLDLNCPPILIETIGNRSLEMQRNL